MGMLIETFLRDDTKLKRQNSIREARDDSKLHLNTLAETTVPDLTINYSSAEMTTKLHGNFGLFTKSTVTTYLAVQKSHVECSRSEMEQW